MLRNVASAQPLTTPSMLSPVSFHTRVHFPIGCIPRRAGNGWWLGSEHPFYLLSSKAGK